MTNCVTVTRVGPAPAGARDIDVPDTGGSRHRLIDDGPPGLGVGGRSGLCVRGPSGLNCPGPSGLNCPGPSGLICRGPAGLNCGGPAGLHDASAGSRALAGCGPGGLNFDGAGRLTVDRHSAEHARPAGPKYISRWCKPPVRRRSLPGAPEGRHFAIRVTMALAFIALQIVSRAQSVPSFRNDILPILSKAGCNSGGCHGALAGKGGFRLSLFGYNPEADWLSMTRESRGRRVELSDPGASLILLKPTTALRHKGGKRLEVNSEDYRVIADWITAGCPPPQANDAMLSALEVSPAESTLAPGGTQQLAVKAKYTNGTEREVTRWSKFTSADETVAIVDGAGKLSVTGPGEGAVTVWFSSQIVTARVVVPFPHEIAGEVYASAPRAGFIDDLVLAQLQRLHLKPSPAAGDATFVRRAFLDTIGRLPTPEEARAFVNDTAPGKHERLAELLLARPEFIDYWTYKWADVLLITGSKLRPDAIAAYHKFIRDRVAANQPWDKFVREIVTARGSSLDNGATNFFAVHPDPESMAENVSQAFLSLSIGCAKCHNHPLEKWTNDQYYAFANLFARVRAKGWGGDARSGDGQRTLYVEVRGDLIQPRTGKPQPPAPLDAPALDPDDPRDRREVLSEWLTSPENPYFTRAIVNRVWANFMGTGLVESVDDIRISNPASNEMLLAALADFLVKQRYDLKALMRVILTSQTYRRSSEPLPENKDERRYYSRFYPRRLMAEVLSDAITDVTGVRDSFTEILLNDGSTEKVTAYTPDTRALQLTDSAVKNYFLKTFGRNAREITCECERSNQPSLVQVLHLSNGSTVNDKLAAKGGRITQILATDPPPAQIVDDAYQLCLSRPPADDQRKKFEEMLKAAKPEEKRQIVEDLYWSLLTSREFLFQH
jgi:Protein of unknown function (DUF1553)/Protein of unknown function (DUF1549)/Bacterial Ig-like domain (group 2)